MREEEGEEEVRTDQGENDYCVFLLLLVKEEIEDGDREVCERRRRSAIFKLPKLKEKRETFPPFFIFVTNCYVYYCYYFYQWNVSQLLSSCRRRRPIVLCRLYTHTQIHTRTKTVRMLCNKKNRKLSGRGAGAGAQTHNCAGLLLLIIMMMIISKRGKGKRRRICCFHHLVAVFSLSLFFLLLVLCVPN